MSSFVMTDCTTHVAGYDLTTDMNELSLTIEVDDQENTTFGGGGYKSRIGGLKDVKAGLKGFWQSATTSAVDPQVFNNLAAEQAVTITPAGSATNAAYMFRAAHFSYELLGGVGDVAPFSASMSGTNGVGLVRGQLAAAKGNVSATGALGSTLLLGAASSTASLYAVFHVFTAGTTITVQVQSDDNAGMSSPTTVATIGPITTVGGTWMTPIAGPITDTYYRLNVSAITGTFNVAGAIGVR